MVQALNLYNDVCRLFLNKLEKKKEKKTAVLLRTSLPLGKNGYSHPAHTIPPLLAQ